MDEVNEPQTEEVLELTPEELELAKTPQQRKEEEAEQKMKDVADAEFKRAFREMKKRLKINSKTQLLQIIWDQGLQYHQLQNVAQEMYEQNQILIKNITELEAKEQA